MFNHPLYLLLLVISFSSYSSTRMGQLIEHIQVKYADDFTNYPIVMINKDELKWRFAQARAFHNDDRFEIIQDYVKEKSGVVITLSDAINFDIYLTILKNSAVAVPLMDDSFFESKVKLCGVFHSDPSSNQRLETERMMGFSVKEAYGELSYSKFKSRLSLNNLKKFSLFHELGHCMDTNFLPASATSIDDSHGVHQSESFAETMGLFFMAKEGVLNISEDRAVMRSIYSRKLGEYFVKSPDTGFGDPHLKYGGIIYHLAPVLKAGGEILRDNPQSILGGKTSELLEMSEKIVNEYSLQSRTFQAIYTYFESGHDYTLKLYREYERKLPRFFKGVVEKIFNYLSITDESITLGFYKEPSIKIPFRNELRKLSVNMFCPSFLSGDQKKFEVLLDEFRLDLESGVGSFEEQETRQSQLINLHERVSSDC